ncbi:hypothetical protein ETAA8_20120 [Anatilimnocola aggregata]|uniref:Uncharacterized protein n=1 Tax=Anatilimnocola aggregata TaxID=2528021 RepID=A0A517Y9M5_9BACT|nr:hypothetical protein [Anatilimnocola aggregata]QDU26928.1 hypothetical protein ETAA8_20120 [Anatilimnocola aggregata]
MRSAITLIATAAFSLHLMLGCCWHHAHGANADAEHVHGPQAYDHCHDHENGLAHFHAHDHENATPNSDESLPATPEVCTDPQCSYLNVGKSPLPQCDLIALLPPVVSEQLVTSRTLLTARAIDDFGRYPPPVRRHAALEHFLN